MSSRERILERIRKAQGRGGSKPSRAELEAVETYLRAHPRGTLPKVEADLVARFRARAEATQCTTEEVTAKAEVPAAVARYLKSSDLPLAGCVWPQLDDLDWKGAGLALEARAANSQDAVGVTGAGAPARGHLAVRSAGVRRPAAERDGLGIEQVHGAGERARAPPLVGLERSRAAAAARFGAGGDVGGGARLSRREQVLAGESRT